MLVRYLTYSVRELQKTGTAYLKDILPYEDVLIFGISKFLNFCFFETHYVRKTSRNKVMYNFKRFNSLTTLSFDLHEWQFCFCEIMFNKCCRNLHIYKTCDFFLIFFQFVGCFSLRKNRS